METAVSIGKSDRSALKRNLHGLIDPERNGFIKIIVSFR